MRIALLSDNHSYFDDELLPLLEDVNEIWHAGDIGDLESLAKLSAIAPIVGVYGNIDDQSVREVYPINQVFEREGVKVLMTHIGGYPGKYTSRVKDLIKDHKPQLYICGHSHICKVIRDAENNLIHMNPGAYGHHGFHTMRTFLKFDVIGGKVNNLQAVELGLRGHIEDNEKEIVDKNDDGDY